MKFGIKKETKVIKTNIEGKVLDEDTTYKVYRKLFFGLIRLYVKICTIGGVDYSKAHEAVIVYTPKVDATSFSERWQAENLIRDMKIEPDKFVRYK